MKSLLHKVAHELAPAPVTAYGSHQVLAIAHAKHNPDLVTLQLAGLPPNTKPLFVCRLNHETKPQVVLFHGDDLSLSHPIGSANLHRMAGNTDLMIRDQAVNMAYDQASGSMTVEHPTLGNLIWKDCQGKDMGWEMTKGGILIAKVKVGNASMEEKELQVVVQVEDAELEVIVLSSMVVKAVNEMTKEVVAETLGHLGETT